jgi:hypothetical protein
MAFTMAEKTRSKPNTQKSIERPINLRRNKNQEGSIGIPEAVLEENWYVIFCLRR